MIPLCSACQFDMTIPADLSAISIVAEGVMHVLETKSRADGKELNIETALREALAREGRTIRVFGAPGSGNGPYLSVDHPPPE